MYTIGYIKWQGADLTLDIMVKTFAVWLGILMLAIANGAIRESVLIPAMDKLLGFVLSGLLLSGLVIAVAYTALPWFGRVAVSKYLMIGISWLCLTLVFEFTFGRFIQGKSWPHLFEAYMFKEGNIWPIVLLVVALAPYMAAKIRNWI